ncbi:MAG: metallophosphoesterase family protein [Terracidiphilus sp.]
MRWGVLSDTHGLLRAEVLPALAGVERILHLGDVGSADILTSLRRIAPVHAVRGNVDRTGPCSRLPETDVLLFEQYYLYLLHNRSELHLNPVAAKFSAVLYGHTHRPLIEWHRDVLYFNPGSCGPRRFELPVTIGFLTIGTDGRLKPEIVQIEIDNTR